MLCVLPIWERPRVHVLGIRLATQLILDRREVNVDRNSKAFGLGAMPTLNVSRSFPKSVINLRLSAIFWMWNDLFMGLWILQNRKKNIQHFYHLDRPVTTCNLFFQGTRCKTWETYTAERFTKPCAGGGWDLHTWNSSGFHSFIVETQKQNVSWDKKLI